MNRRTEEVTVSAALIAVFLAAWLAVGLDAADQWIEVKSPHFGWRHDAEHDVALDPFEGRCGFAMPRLGFTQKLRELGTVTKWIQPGIARHRGKAEKAS